MKLTHKIVFFENSDSVDEIKLFYKTLNERGELAIKEKETQRVDDEIKNFISLKSTADISLIDYLIRNNENLPHNFKYNETIFGFIGKFSGQLADELNGIQNVFGVNVIYFSPEEISEYKRPQLNLKESFEKNISIIRENFLCDITKDVFNQNVSNYLEFKKLLKVVDGVVVTQGNLQKLK